MQARTGFEFVTSQDDNSDVSTVDYYGLMDEGVFAAVSQVESDYNNMADMIDSIVA